jgi:hypothetical protein
MALSSVLCSLWQQIIMSLVRGWWVCRHKGQSMLVAGTPQIYWILSSAWRGTYITLQQNVMYVPAFSSHKDYLFTYEYVFTQLVLIYLHDNVFDPVFIYSLISTLHRLLFFYIITSWIFVSHLTSSCFFTFTHFFYDVSELDFDTKKTGCHKLKTVFTSIREENKKVKCALVQALRLCTGHTAHRGSRGIALLFHDHGTIRGWGVSVTSRPLLTPGKDPVPIAQEAGWAPGPVWTCAENLAPTGIRYPVRPARSQSLYRLRYPAHSIMKGS